MGSQEPNAIRPLEALGEDDVDVLTTGGTGGKQSPEQ